MTPHKHLSAIAAAWREYRLVRDNGGDPLPAIEALSYAIHAGELTAKLDPEPLIWGKPPKEYGNHDEYDSWMADNRSEK